MASNEIRHRAELRRHYETVPPVHGSEARLGQVFLNLLVNAAQAIPEGKTSENEVTVSIKPASQDRVLVEIRDTGVGMNAEVRARIFDPFFTTKARGVGTGLGLAICARIVKDLGGEIAVESHEGAGTTFSVFVPYARIATTAVEAPPLAEAQPKRPARVLVVDDEPMLCSVVERILLVDHDVTVATAAKRALQLIEQGERFDVILCDLMMPQMSGMELEAALRRTAPDQAGKMVFMTGGAFSQEAAEFLAKSSNPTIDKPFKSATLRRAVQDLVDKA